jgi:hypothetical protein
MGITLGSNFTVNTNLPLDDRIVVADNTARDAIDAGRRYEGLIVYSIGAGTNYQLVGGILNADWTELSGGGGGTTTVLSERFSGDASTLVFNLSQDPLIEENTQIYINGVYQQKNTYSVSGTAITFTGAPPIGTDNIEVTYFTSILANAGNTTVNVERFNGDGSTVAFVLAFDPVGEENTFVYVDGVYQQKDTYSLSTTTLTFTEAPATGTNNIEITYFTNVAINTVPDNSIATSKLQDGAVTLAKLAPSNYVETASNPDWSNSSVTPTDVTGLTLSFTTTGRLLEVGLFNGVTGLPRIFARSDLVADDDVGGTIDFLHGSTVFATNRFSMKLSSTSTAYEIRTPASAFKAYVTLAAGTYTFKTQAYALTNNSIYVRDVKMYVREL